jgi:outer membrane protein
MKTKLKLKIIGSLLMMVFIIGNKAQVKAQNAAQPLVLTAKQAVEYALKNHDDIKNAELDVKIANAKMKELIGIGLPQIDGSADFNKFIEIPTQFVPAEFFDGEPGTYAPVKFGQPYSASVGVSGSQLLFDGSYFVGLKASKVYGELSEKTLEQTKIEVAANVTKAYYLVMVAKERLKQLNVDLARIGKVKDDTKALYENGFVEKIDYDRIELNYNLVESAKSQTERFTLNSYQILKFQMGMDLKTPIELAEDITSINTEIAVLANEGVDYKSRIEYSILQTQDELLGLDVKRYRSLRYPSIVLFGSYSANASRNEFNFFNPDYKWYPTSIVGASLKMPLVGGFQKTQKIRQAKFAKLKVENTLTKVEQGIQLEYDNVLTTLNNNIDKLSTQSKNRDLAREIARVSKIKYDQGVGSNLEVIDAESSLREAETNYYTALLEAIISKIDLEKAKGTLKY